MSKVIDLAKFKEKKERKERLKTVNCFQFGQELTKEEERALFDIIEKGFLLDEERGEEVDFMGLTREENKALIDRIFWEYTNDNEKIK